MHALLLITLFCTALAADQLRIDTPAEWSNWEMPRDLIRFNARGNLQLTKFRKDINAVANAAQFRHLTRTRGDRVAGGLWEAGSNPRAAARVIDGDPSTYWQASPDDVLGDWFVQIDLGRAVLAKEIRLHFPDRDGAHPFRQFTLFTATGMTSDALDDLFIFSPVYFTTQPNRSTEVVIPLSFDLQDSAQVIDEGLDVNLQAIDQYRLVQYINFTVESFDPEGALGEIEVVAVGDNISIGTVGRGGSVIDGLTARSNENILDADMNTSNSILPVGFEGRVRTWEEQGTWFYVDLGAVFWLDELFLYVLRQREGTVGSVAGAPRAFNFLYSDGTRAIRSGLPIPESFDFTPLIVQPDPTPVRYFRYVFAPRRIRYLFWHAHIPQGWGSRWTEMMLYSPGYPAQVVLRSPFIDLGTLANDGRPKVINRLVWDADLPAGTHLHMRSRSGNSQSAVYTFYNKIGEEVKENKWLSLPKVLRGPVDTTVVVSEDWDEWSETYTVSGEAFKSQNPRRFIQLEMTLQTDDPTVAPQVNALSIEYEETLLQRAVGSVAPRSTKANTDTRFTYALWPKVDGEDAGFNRMRFGLPSLAQDIEVRMGGRIVAPTRLDISADSLHIDLPQPVRNDLLEVAFTTRVTRNGTVISLELGSTEHPGLWQSVEAASRRANVVMLPEVIGERRLIEALDISSSVLTPNGDGLNDEVYIRLVTLNVDEAAPHVDLFDLRGKRLVRLEATSTRQAEYAFAFTGRDAAGRLLPPGVYLYRVDLGADSGQDTALHSLSIAY